MWSCCGHSLYMLFALTIKGVVSFRFKPAGLLFDSTHCWVQFSAQDRVTGTWPKTHSCTIKPALTDQIITEQHVSAFWHFINMNIVLWCDKQPADSESWHTLIWSHSFYWCDSITRHVSRLTVILYLHLLDVSVSNHTCSTWECQQVTFQHHTQHLGTFWNFDLVCHVHVLHKIIFFSVLVISN